MSQKSLERIQRFSAGVIPVLQGSTPLFLLLRSYNYWDFPKGAVEKDETPLEAARRELQEETGIFDVKFLWGEDFVETPPYARGKIARYYLGEVSDEKVHLGVNPDLGRPEHQEYRWVTYNEASRLLGPRLLAVLEWAHRKLPS